MSSSDNTDTYIVILTNEIYLQLPVDLVTTEPQGTGTGMVPLSKNPAC